MPLGANESGRDTVSPSLMAPLCVQVNFGGAVQVHGAGGAPSTVAPARLAAPAVNSSPTVISGRSAPELLVMSILNAQPPCSVHLPSPGDLVIEMPPASAVSPSPSSTGGKVWSSVVVPPPPSSTGGKVSPPPPAPPSSTGGNASPP